MKISVKIVVCLTCLFTTGYSSPIADCPTDTEGSFYIGDDTNACVYHWCVDGQLTGTAPFSCARGTGVIMGHFSSDNPCVAFNPHCDGTQITNSEAVAPTGIPEAREGNELDPGFMMKISDEPEVDDLQQPDEETMENIQGGDDIDYYQIAKQLWDELWRASPWAYPREEPRPKPVYFAVGPYQFPNNDNSQMSQPINGDMNGQDMRNMGPTDPQMRPQVPVPTAPRQQPVDQQIRPQNPQPVEPRQQPEKRPQPTQRTMSTRGFIMPEIHTQSTQRTKPTQGFMMPVSMRPIRYQTSVNGQSNGKETDNTKTKIPATLPSIEPTGMISEQFDTPAPVPAKPVGGAANMNGMAVGDTNQNKMQPREEVDDSPHKPVQILSGQYIVNGMKLYGSYDVMDCMTMCMGKCRAIDYDVKDKSCWIHYDDTVCEPLRTKETCVHVRMTEQCQQM